MTRAELAERLTALAASLESYAGQARTRLDHVTTTGHALEARALAQSVVSETQNTTLETRNPPPEVKPLPGATPAA